MVLISVAFTFSNHNFSGDRLPFLVLWTKTVIEEEKNARSCFWGVPWAKKMMSRKLTSPHQQEAETNHKVRWNLLQPIEDTIKLWRILIKSSRFCLNQFWTSCRWSTLKKFRLCHVDVMWIYVNILPRKGVPLSVKRSEKIPSMSRTLNQQWVLIADITKLPSASFFVTRVERTVIEH